MITFNTKNMTTLKSKIALTFLSLAAFANNSFAQQGTLEMITLGSSNVALGPSIAPVVVNFREDITNATVGTTFRNYSPALNVTTSFANQQYNTTYGNISTGMAFGAGNTSSNGGSTQQSAVNPIYNILGASLVQPPQNGMFVSSPTGTIVPNFQLGGRGVGQDPETTQSGKDMDNGNADDYNFGMAVFTNVEPLFDANLDKAGRYYYGQIIFKFSRPVKNPVLHIGGLGGSYNYAPIGGGPRQISYFSTEMELQNAGIITSDFMAGNENFNVSGNNILNSSATPNGGSFDDGTTQGGFLTYGAATGSVRINGTVSELVYNVYVRGSAASQFNFSQPQSAITSATRRPLNGDLFYIGISLNKPTQQISGFVFNDKDGLKDAGGGDINKSAGVANPKTNVGGTLYANLFSGSTFVASTPIGADGSYLFDNVATGTYTVRLNNLPGVNSSALPTGWVNTGENGSTNPGNVPGSDGSVDGISSGIVVNSENIKTEVNFGIERVPESVPFARFINSPLYNAVITLNTSNLPPLTGSDPEDQPLSGSLISKSVQITTLPTTSTLIYAGVPVFAGQIITSYDPNLLQIQFTTANPAGTTNFYYAYVDAAGKPDPTPAEYKLTWPNPGTLDITLSDFTATKNNCNANLVWKTASEINSDKFEIEVSTSENANFTKIETVSASGNSTIAKSYGFNYPMQTGVVYYFRLKMFSKNGIYTYSIIRKVSCDGGKTEISVRPNPTADVVKVFGMEKGKNTILVLNASGRLVASKTTSNNNDELNISNLAAGEYLLKIQNENGTSTVKKIVKY
jgi:Secretion system C-terminal sorting domain